MKMFALLLAMVGATSCAPPPQADALAGEAVVLARMVADPNQRDAALQTVSRALRERHRARALEAAQAMRDPHEASTFGTRPDAITVQIREGVAAMAGRERRCRRLLDFGYTQAVLEEQIVSCFMTSGAGYHEAPRPALLMEYAAALPPGETPLGLLRMAFGIAESRDHAAAGAALAAIRALRPRLSPEALEEADAFLDTPSVHLFENAPERALESARRSTDVFAIRNLYNLTSQLIDGGHIDVAIRAAAAWDASDGCPFNGADSQIGENTALRNRRNLALFLDRLLVDPHFQRVCPAGLPAATTARLELAADRLDRAAAALDRPGLDPLDRSTLVDIAARHRERGEIDRARTLLLALKQSEVPIQSLADDAQSHAAHVRFGMICGLVLVNEHAHALALARAYPGPGWRAAAIAAVVATRETGPGHFVMIGAPEIPPLN